MSQHYVKKHAPPPGLSSFTKIRLGWISPSQVVLVQPGETRLVTLAPLGRGGETLAVKVPIGRGQYLLVENRQPVGYDLVLPDSGILVLKVNPQALEGSGTVRVMDAKPDRDEFCRAAYRLDREEGHIFMDESNNVSIIPLWEKNDRLGVLITTADKGEAALAAALAIRDLKGEDMEPRSRREKVKIKECLELFRRHDFTECAELAQKYQAADQ